MSMGASAGGARAAASVYGYGVVENTHGAGYQAGQMIRPFPGTQFHMGSAEFWFWVILGGAMVYMLGVHWTLGSVRSVL